VLGLGCGQSGPWTILDGMFRGATVKAVGVGQNGADVLGVSACPFSLFA